MAVCECLLRKARFDAKVGGPYSPTTVGELRAEVCRTPFARTPPLLVSTFARRISKSAPADENRKEIDQVLRRQLLTAVALRESDTE